MDHIAAVIESQLRLRVVEEVAKIDRRLADELRVVRAELAGVAAQRDAYLTRSVELATRVTELEARLAAAAPVEAVEVGGFRVGDLVEYVADGGRYARITDMRGGRSWISTMTFSVQTSALAAKPVEVGDMVRIAKSPFKWRVLAIDGAVASLQAGFAGPLAECIAVAP